MPSSIDHDLQDLADEFDLIGDPNDPERYRHLMDLGRRLAPLVDAERVDANKVRGCASQVWLITEPQPDRTLRFRGDSDSDIVRGLVAILVRLYSQRTAAEILAFDIKAAFERLGFAGAISTQRSNGFFSMVQRVRRDAEAVAGAAISPRPHP
jgi:cysteine desulfuration protein SufE